MLQLLKTANLVIDPYQRPIIGKGRFPPGWLRPSEPAQFAMNLSLGSRNQSEMGCRGAVLYTGNLHHEADLNQWLPEAQIRVPRRRPDAAMAQDR
jgi:hypothetical protein